MTFSYMKKSISQCSERILANSSIQKGFNISQKLLILWSLTQVFRCSVGFKSVYSNSFNSFSETSIASIGSSSHIVGN